jgi:hypothetical protein
VASFLGSEVHATRDLASLVLNNKVSHPGETWPVLNGVLLTSSRGPTEVARLLDVPRLE